MTADEIRAAIAASPELQALAADGNYGAIAAALSKDRNKLVPTEIGSGTVVATLKGIGAGGGAFLDTLEVVGATNRDVFWTMDLITQGRLRIDLEATREGLTELSQSIPSLLPEVTALLKLGFASDPVPVNAVSDALEGGK